MFGVCLLVVLLCYWYVYDNVPCKVCTYHLCEGRTLFINDDMYNGYCTDYRMTLAWYDPPNQQGTTSKALLHNLDLLLVDPNGRT